MFLSTRWGVPSYVIESLPSSEFTRQKQFWDNFKWGVEDDLMSMLLSQVISARTGKKPEKDNYIWKHIAVNESGAIKKKVGPVSVASIRTGFMAICSFIGRKKK